jgi:hypothetical protein
LISAAALGAHTPFIVASAILLAARALIEVTAATAATAARPAEIAAGAARTSLKIAAFFTTLTTRTVLVRAIAIHLAAALTLAARTFSARALLVLPTLTALIHHRTRSTRTVVFGAVAAAFLGLGGRDLQDHSQEHCGASQFQNLHGSLPLTCRLVCLTRIVRGDMTKRMPRLKKF